jgi:DNA-binding beta-propeller fold protein YncE
MLALLASPPGALVGRAQAEPSWTVLAGGRMVAAEFDRPQIYVADTRNHRITKLSPQGEPLAQWGPRGSAPGRFAFPSGVALDGQGNLNVADYGIKKLSPGGEPLAQWWDRGSSPSQFLNPVGVAIDATGNLYVADTGNHRIQKLSLDEPTAAR